MNRDRDDVMPAADVWGAQPTGTPKETWKPRVLETVDSLLARTDLTNERKAQRLYHEFVLSRGTIARMLREPFENVAEWVRDPSKPRVPRAPNVPAPASEYPRRRS